MINEKRLLDTFIGYAMIDSETKNEVEACHRRAAHMEQLLTAEIITHPYRYRCSDSVIDHKT